MKSKATKVRDFKEIVKIPEGFVKVEVTDLTADIENELQRIAKKFGRLIEASPGEKLENGDIAVLKLSSSNPKFQKDKLPVSVGKGFFNKAIESELIGMPVGDKKEIEAEESKVVIEVISAKKRQIPPITLEMIIKDMKEEDGYYQESEIEGIKTIEDYKKFYENDLLEMRIAKVILGCFKLPEQQIVDDSEFIIDEEELDNYCEENYENLKEYCPDEEEFINEIKKMTGIDNVTPDNAKKILIESPVITNRFKYMLYAYEIYKDDEEVKNATEYVEYHAERLMNNAIYDYLYNQRIIVHI